MRKIITAITGLAIAGGAYLAGSAVRSAHDGSSQHALMSAIVAGQSIGIDRRTMVCRPQH